MFGAVKLFSILKPELFLDNEKVYIYIFVPQQYFSIYSEVRKTQHYQMDKPIFFGWVAFLHARIKKVLSEGF